MIFINDYSGNRIQIKTFCRIEKTSTARTSKDCAIRYVAPSQHGIVSTTTLAAVHVCKCSLQAAARRL